MIWLPLASSQYNFIDIILKELAINVCLNRQSYYQRKRYQKKENILRKRNIIMKY